MYTYCGVIGDDGWFPDVIVVEVEPGDVPDGVPLFATRGELREFMKEEWQRLKRIDHGGIVDDVDDSGS